MLHQAELTRALGLQSPRRRILVAIAPTVDQMWVDQMWVDQMCRSYQSLVDLGFAPFGRVDLEFPVVMAVT